MSFPLYHSFLNLSTSEIQITASQISHSENVTWNYRQPEQNFMDVICLNWPFFSPWELLSYSLHIFQFLQQMKYDLIYMLDHFQSKIVLCGLNELESCSGRLSCVLKELESWNPGNLIYYDIAYNAIRVPVYLLFSCKQQIEKPADHFAHKKLMILCRWIFLLLVLWESNKQTSTRDVLWRQISDCMFWSGNDAHLYDSSVDKC